MAYIIKAIEIEMRNGDTVTIDTDGDDGTVTLYLQSICGGRAVEVREERLSHPHDGVVRAGFPLDAIALWRINPQDEEDATVAKSAPFKVQIEADSPWAMRDALNRELAQLDEYERTLTDRTVS